MKQVSPRADSLRMHGARQSAYILKIDQIENVRASGQARPRPINRVPLFLAGRAESPGRRYDYWPEKTKMGTYVCQIIRYRDRT
jgi:hypothetical protein